MSTIKPRLNITKGQAPTPRSDKNSKRNGFNASDPRQGPTTRLSHSMYHPESGPGLKARPIPDTKVKIVGGR